MMLKGRLHMFACRPALNTTDFLSEFDNTETQCGSHTHTYIRLQSLLIKLFITYSRN